jgi:AbrB family looped-hinge helix DNA binding protein
MTFTVTITSQGQISIPIQLRRKLGLDKNKKAFIREENGELVIKPVKDLLDLAGSLHHKAIKNKSIGQIMELERKAVEEGMIEREIRFLKQNRQR